MSPAPQIKPELMTCVLTGWTAKQFWYHLHNLSIFRTKWEWFKWERDIVVSVSCYWSWKNHIISLFLGFCSNGHDFRGKTNNNKKEKREYFLWGGSERRMTTLVFLIWLCGFNSYFLSKTFEGKIKKREKGMKFDGEWEIGRFRLTFLPLLLVLWEMHRLDKGKIVL